MAPHSNHHTQHPVSNSPFQNHWKSSFPLGKQSVSVLYHLWIGYGRLLMGRHRGWFVIVLRGSGWIYERTRWSGRWSGHEIRSILRLIRWIRVGLVVFVPVDLLQGPIKKKSHSLVFFFQLKINILGVENLLEFMKNR